MKVSFFVSSVLLATLAMVEAGINPGGRGGDTSAGVGGKLGPTGPGGEGGKAGGAAAGGSTATGDGGKGGAGGLSSTGAGGSGGGSTTNAGVTYVFEDSQFGPGSSFGGPTGITGGNGAAGGSSGNSQGGTGAAGGSGPVSGPGGISRGGDSRGGSSTGGASKGGNSGNGGAGGQGWKTSLDFSPTLSVPVVPRSVRDLFIRRALNARNVPSRFSARAVAKVNEKGQITEAEFINMINNRQKFPTALEAALVGHSILNTYTPPANRAECPLASHLATYAISVLKSGNIPPGIMAAVNNPKNGWTKNGGSAPQGKSATPQGNSAAAPQGKAAVPQANKPAAPQAKAPAPAPVKGAKAPRSIYARTAYPEGVMFDSQLFGRDAYAEAFYEDFDLYARDAEAEAFDNHHGLYARDTNPSAIHDDFDLHARSAEPEAFSDDDFDLYARSTHPEPFLFSSGSDLHARNAQNAMAATRPSSPPINLDQLSDHYTGGYRKDYGPPAPASFHPLVARAIPNDPSSSSSSSFSASSHNDNHNDNIQPVPHVSAPEIQGLIRTLMTNPQAQRAVLREVNRNPLLAHYAQELESRYD